MTNKTEQPKLLIRIGNVRTTWLYSILSLTHFMIDILYNPTVPAFPLNTSYTQDANYQTFTKLFSRIMYKYGAKVTEYAGLSPTSTIVIGF